MEIDTEKVYIRNEVILLADMGTKEAAKKWGVSQARVQYWCRTHKDPRITQDKKGSPYHIPKSFPNPFRKTNR